MKLFIPFFAFLLFWTVPTEHLHAQITGGQTTFNFLKLSTSARITALGGAVITVQDDDVNLALQNPAALNAEMHNKIAFNHQFYLADIQSGYVSYGRHLEKYRTTLHGGIQYIGYGDIKQTDEFGTVLGQIRNTEWAMTLGAGRQLTERLTLGINARLAASYLDIYSATALTADAGLMYSDTSKNFSATLVLKNMGAQLSTYAGTREDVPYDIQLGVSKQLKYLPFRITVIAHHLQQWDIRYDDPNAPDDDLFLFGAEEAASDGSPVLDNFFRHLIFNGEFLLGKAQAFKIRFGYNHLRKRELTVTNYRSLAGFSGGIGFGVKKMRVDIGYAAYHLAGGGFHLGLGMKI